ncbi:hypothetical protein KY386_01310 [Candidatus Parcubacteria bacterium]|nr:hypothetical protein [Candidatus Parcubacteria bacterium]
MLSNGEERDEEYEVIPRWEASFALLVVCLVAAVCGITDRLRHLRRPAA